MATEQMQYRRQSWADAPVKVLGLVVGRLPTLADRFRLGAVCRPWHAAVRQLPRRRQLPWLALSLPSSPTADSAAFYSLSDKTVYKLPFPGYLLDRYTDMMLVFDLDEDADQFVESKTDGCFLRQRGYHYEADEGGGGLNMALLPSLERQYCVESRGRILIVERYCRRYRDGNRTFLFKVFQRAPIRRHGRFLFVTWVMLESLDGEALFLGGSAPRSFPASDHCGDDAYCIYFTEDQNVSLSRSENEDWYDDPAQPCRDIGRYCMRDKSISFLKGLPSNERRSPPIWLYLSDGRQDVSN